MKKLLLALFVSFSCSAFAQNEYLQNNPEWTVIRAYSGSYPCIEYDSAHYFLNGDSVYNSLQWKVLWRCGHKWSSWQSPNPNTSCNFNYTYCDTVPTGLIRSNGLQMYFVFWNDTAQRLLYDFNMTIGNQPPQTFTYCCPGSETVTAIDSFYTTHGYRKRYYLNNSIQPSFIEGVGSSYGLIEPFGPQLDQYYQLICYGLNDTAWFPSQGSYCDVITSTPAPATPEISVQLVPNPANQIVDVQFTGGVIESIEVYDVNGRMVRSVSGVQTLFVGDLSNGLYLVRVISADKIYSQRLIIE